MVREPKENILISFSGGETSGFMLQHILKKYPSHNFEIVFANTGEENEETLEFIKRCEEHFNVKVTWLEYERLSFKQVDFNTAYRSHDETEIKNKWQNHPFRKYISHFGIPNIENMTCTRDLKEYIINRYLSSIGWTDSNHTKAIGIRIDEIDRLGKYWYPVALINVTKPMINSFWSKMPFRLELKGYEGNCKVCWKKSIRKLVTIMRQNPEWFAFCKQMEVEYEMYVKPSMTHRIIPPCRFFRQNKTVDDILELSKDESIENAIDDSVDTNYQISILHDGTELDISNGCEESCEVYV